MPIDAVEMPIEAVEKPIGTDDIPIDAYNMQKFKKIGMCKMLSKYYPLFNFVRLICLGGYYTH